MIDVRPFKGIRFNLEKISEIQDVVTPPYDVISPQQQHEYYAYSPYNCIRLILGKDEKNDDRNNNKYTRAASFFKRWRDDSILIQDVEESFYIYAQKYRIESRSITRIGFIGLVKLVDFRDGIFPHEKTLKGPIEDRLKLMRTTQAQFGQIFSLFDDKQNIIDSILNDEKIRALLYSMEDKNNVEHSLWRISDKKMLKTISETLKHCTLIIADGHHRYTTALEYSKENRHNSTAQYTMMTFVNSFNEGLLILPTNRLVRRIKNVSNSEILSKIDKLFHLEEMISKEELVKRLPWTLHGNAVDKENVVFGLYITDLKKSFLLKPKKNQMLDTYLAGKPESFRKLDVIIAHKLLLEEVLGLSEELQEKSPLLTYVKGNEETLQLLNNNAYQLGIFVKPPQVKDVFQTVLDGVTMPQKSTFFYPKIWTGFVFNKL